MAKQSQSRKTLLIEAKLSVNKLSYMLKADDKRLKIDELFIANCLLKQAVETLKKNWV